MYKNYYIYRHIRLDTNEPFYIGISTCKPNSKTYNEEYNRAFLKARRPNIWTNVINKTDYIVQIIFESEDLFLVKNKEIELIKLYGRKNLKKGPLCNLTDGGELNENRVCSKELKVKRSNNAKNMWSKLSSEERLIRIKKKYSIKVINILNNKIFNSISEAFESVEIGYKSRSHFGRMIKNKIKNKTNFKLI